MYMFTASREMKILCKYVPGEFENTHSFVDGLKIDFESINCSAKYTKIRFTKNLSIYEVEPPLLPANYRDFIFIPSFYGPFYREILTFYHFQNALVSTRGISFENGDWWCFHGYHNQNISVKTAYTHVIWSCYKLKGFGHWLHDHLCSLLLIPRWVFRKHPVLVVPSSPDIVSWTLNAAGLGFLQVEYATNYYVYAKNVYVYKTKEHAMGCGFYTFQKLKTRFHNYYNLTHIVPTNYYALNKEPNKQRHIKNMNELINTLQNATQKAWKILPNNYTDMNYFAKVLASTRFIIMPCGAICFNSFFMQPHTAMLVLMGDRMDFCDINACFMMKIWMIAQIHPDIPHYGGDGGNANIPEVLENYYRLEYAIENNAFPPFDHNLYTYSFDRELLPRRVGRNVFKLYYFPF